MIDPKELEQLVLFKKLGTLSKVSEQLLISVPSLSRSMQDLEEEFGVPLFDRSANRIALNETGERAVTVANRILDTIRQGVNEVKQFDQSLKTITIFSVAPAPLWFLLTELSDCYPEKQIKHQICSTDKVLEAIKNKKIDLAVLPFNYVEEKTTCLPFLSENLDVVVPKTHTLARQPSVNFSDIDGYNFLLMKKIGFWNDLVFDKMPSSKFLVQSSRFEFEELSSNSTLPRFSTNLSQDKLGFSNDRVSIPITDSEAHVLYHLVSLNPEICLLDFIHKVRQY